MDVDEPVELATLPDPAVVAIMAHLAATNSESWAALAKTCKRFWALSRSPEIEVHLDISYVCATHPIHGEMLDYYIHGACPKTATRQIAKVRVAVSGDTKMTSLVPLHAYLPPVVVDGEQVLPWRPKLHHIYRCARHIKVDFVASGVYKNVAEDAVMMNYLDNLISFEWNRGLISAGRLGWLLAAAPHLKRLDIEFCRDMLAQSPLRSASLVELRLRPRTRVDDNDQWYLDLVRNAPNLRKVSLTGILENGQELSITSRQLAAYKDHPQIIDFKISNIIVL